MLEFGNPRRKARGLEIGWKQEGLTTRWVNSHNSTF